MLTAADAKAFPRLTRIVCAATRAWNALAGADVRWQHLSVPFEVYADAKSGTTVVMRYRYDNSAENVANPNRPPERVTAGNRAVDEMAHLWLQVLPAARPGGQGDPRMVLQEALARHHIENNPALQY